MENNHTLSQSSHVSVMAYGLSTTKENKKAEIFAFCWLMVYISTFN